MATIQQFEKLLPYAHELGVKYELRVCSHLLSIYLSLISVDNTLTLAQWDRCYVLLTQMVLLLCACDLDSMHRKRSLHSPRLLQYTRNDQELGRALVR